MGCCATRNRGADGGAVLEPLFPRTAYADGGEEEDLAMDDAEAFYEQYERSRQSSSESLGSRQRGSGGSPLLGLLSLRQEAEGLSRHLHDVMEYIEDAAVGVVAAAAAAENHATAAGAAAAAASAPASKAAAAAAALAAPLLADVDAARTTSQLLMWKLRQLEIYGDGGGAVGGGGGASTARSNVEEWRRGAPPPVVTRKDTPFGVVPNKAFVRKTKASLEELMEDVRVHIALLRSLARRIRHVLAARAAGGHSNTLAASGDAARANASDEHIVNAHGRKVTREQLIASKDRRGTPSQQCLLPPRHLLARLE